MSSPRRRMPRPVAIIVGALLVAVPAAFVSYNLVTGWERASQSLSRASVLLLCVAWVTAALAMLSLAHAWGRVLSSAGHSLEPALLIATYFVGEIGKYVPGWVWAVLGRSELVQRHGVTRRVAYASVFLSLGFFVSMGLVGTAILAPFLLDRNLSVAVPVAAAAACVLAVVIFHPSGSRLVFQLGERILGRRIDINLPQGRDAARLALFHLPAWVLIAASTCAVAYALDPGADIARVAFAALASWVAGFVSPLGAGLGAREAVFAAASGLSPAVGAAAAVVSRLVFASVDAGGALVSTPFLRRRRKPQQRFTSAT